MLKKHVSYDDFKRDSILRENNQILDNKIEQNHFAPPKVKKV